MNKNQSQVGFFIYNNSEITIEPTEITKNFSPN